jgi:hypothetical protein
MYVSVCYVCMYVCMYVCDRYICGDTEIMEHRPSSERWDDHGVDVTDLSMGHSFIHLYIHLSLHPSIHHQYRMHYYTVWCLSDNDRLSAAACIHLIRSQCVRSARGPRCRRLLSQDGGAERAIVALEITGSGCCDN